MSADIARHVSKANEDKERSGVTTRLYARDCEIVSGCHGIVETSASGSGVVVPARSIARDDQQAISWLRKAAEQGNENAKTYLADMPSKQEAK
jgi:TPR repeat protein